jgi:hypothetical protein
VSLVECRQIRDNLEKEVKSVRHRAVQQVGVVLRVAARHFGAAGHGRLAELEHVGLKREQIIKPFHGEKTFLKGQFGSSRSELIPVKLIKLARRLAVTTMQGSHLPTSTEQSTNRSRYLSGDRLALDDDSYFAGREESDGGGGASSSQCAVARWSHSTLNCACRDSGCLVLSIPDVAVSWWPLT